MDREKLEKILLKVLNEHKNVPLKNRYDVVDAALTKASKQNKRKQNLAEITSVIDNSTGEVLEFADYDEFEALYAGGMKPSELSGTEADLLQLLNDLGISPVRKEDRGRGDETLYLTADDFQKIGGWLSRRNSRFEADRINQRRYEDYRLDPENLTTQLKQWASDQDWAGDFDSSYTTDGDESFSLSAVMDRAHDAKHEFDPDQWSVLIDERGGETELLIYIAELLQSGGEF